ncbi:MAG: acyl-CoA dehydrogenase family protein [Gammaproteobacteria bacterium]
MLADSADRIFADLVDKALLDAAEEGEFPEKLLGLVVANGFHEIAVEDSGVALADGLSILRVAGRHAVPLPLPEIILANRWLGRTDELVSVGMVDADGVAGVPWGRRAAQVIGISRDGEAVLCREFDVIEGRNLAGEPRDRVVNGRSEPLELPRDALELLAVSRVVMMAGALERVLGLSLGYVSEREQFGRPISRFQVIQHHLAVMAAEVAAASRSAAAALAGLGTKRQTVEVAQGKIRVGESVGDVVALAQQVHGAMGYTHEHRLHHYTRRLGLHRHSWMSCRRGRRRR